MSISMGSIGSCSIDPTSERIKGFIPKICRDERDIAAVITEHVLPIDDGSATRASVRMFTANTMLRSYLASLSFPWRDTCLGLEAYIPLGIDGIGGLVYFGGNLPARENTPSHKVAEQWGLLDGALSTPPSRHPLPNGFTVEILKQPDRADLEDLVGVLSDSYTSYMTNFDIPTVDAMFEENVVAVARNERRRIVASSQGEAANLDNIVGTNRRMKVVELTETATLPPYRGRGLSRFCKKEIMDHIRADQGEYDLVFFTESRCNSRSVLRQNHSLGGVSAGRLPRHCRIASKQQDLEQDGIYGDLFVFHWPLLQAA